jgi:hypothetical protein
MKVFILPHETYCLALGRCVCEESAGIRPRRIPSSLTLPAGSVTPGLDDALLLLPEVAKAARTGDLLVRRELPTMAVEPSAVPPRAPSRKKRKSEGGEA